MIPLDTFIEYVAVRDKMDRELTARGHTQNLLTATDEAARKWRDYLIIAEKIENQILGEPDFLID